MLCFQLNNAGFVNESPHAITRAGFRL